MKARLRVSAEEIAHPRIEDDPLALKAQRFEICDAAAKEADDFGDQIAVGAVDGLRAGPGVSRMHQYRHRLRMGEQRFDAGFLLKTRDVVDHVRAEVEDRLHHRRLAGIDRDFYPRALEVADHRSETLDFNLILHLLPLRVRRFGSEVQPVSAVLDQSLPMGDRLSEIEKASAIREGVLGEIDNADELNHLPASYQNDSSPSKAGIIVRQTTCQRLSSRRKTKRSRPASRWDLPLISQEISKR